MLKNGLLFIRNTDKLSSKIQITKEKNIRYNFGTRAIDGNAIRNFLAFLKKVHTQYRNIKIPLIINLGKAGFADKLTICMLETICYTLIVDYNHFIYLMYNITPDISTEGFGSSLLLLLGTGKKEDIEKFKKKFEYDLYRNHYRKILSGLEEPESDFLCKLMSDINSFLKLYNVEAACSDDIAEVVVELVGNAIEHTKSDCLLDIDVAPEYIHKDTGEVCQGINIVVLSYSDILLGDALKNKIHRNNSLNGRYLQVEKARINHQKHFDDYYTEEDFFNIASFQHRISGSESKSVNGGTGLTKLICSLEKRSEAHNCYVVSGNRVVYFIHDLLEYDNNKWIGFNKTHDFINDIPADNVVVTCPVYIPGAAYNLNFVMKSGGENG